MPCVINPYGRVVPIDDPKEYERWLAEPGFVKATKEQEAQFVRERMIMIKQMSEPTDNKDGIYLATVTQGGKDGYSRASVCLTRELEDLGIPVKTHYSGQKVALLFHNPYSILRLESPYRIIYTMFESDKIPDDWKEYLEAADLVLVPSRWCQSVFAKAGIASTVVPLGYDQTVFKYFERPKRRKERQNFTFLHYDAFNIRKGFPEVFKAFVKAFQKDEPVRMIFKTRLDRRPLPITASEYPNIEIIEGKKTEVELVEIINRSDCFVFPSRGEGFGITPLEAMATGMPAIVPNAHGISEYFDPEFMYEVKVEGTCPGLYTKYKGQDVGNMVVCSVDDLARQMRWIYEHQDEARKMGKKASEYAQGWTIRKSAEKLKEIITEVLNNPVPDHPLRNVLSLDPV